MQTKPNDLLATLMFQPEMSIEDLYTVGITPDNTSLQNKDYYKNLDPVKEAFTNDEGKFDEAKFNSFYDSVSLLYNDYANKVAVDDIAKNYKYDPFDWRYLDKDKEDVVPTMSFEKNPMMEGMNIEAMGIFSPSNWSIREIAQTEKVFNTETGKFEDWTPNDKGGLFKALARPTLVLATWDEDGVHLDENGRQRSHKKGEYKYNPVTGKPYYETLGNREIYDKDVLHISDTLTKEGTKINKFDFFDSDSLDKSVGGTVAKMTATVAPAVLGAFVTPVGIVYGGLSAAIALSQLIPTLGKAINGFFTNDNENTAVGRALNTAEGYTARFARSTSDHSRERMVSIENAASLITDISMQLFQQRAIQYIPRLFKNNPSIYNNAKLARNLSYAYMSGTSALESYSAFKQAGADDRVAGLGMFATIGAFYKLMSIDYFRDSFFKGSWFDDNNVKSPVWNVAEDFMKAIKREGDDIAKEVAKNTVEGNRATLRELTKRFTDAIRRTGKPWRPSTFWERSFAEGAEEVMEEGFQDAIKATFKGAEALGIPMNKEREKLDFGFSTKDFLQRYIMSFVGGLAGGAIFQGYNSLSNIGVRSVLDTPDAHLSELVKLISDGRADEIKEILSKWHNDKRFGSNNLSATKVATVTGIDGDTIVSAEKTADDISQNDFVYKALLEQVNYVDRVLSEEGFKNILSDFQKAAEKINPNIEKSAVAADLAQKLGLHSLVLKDLNRLAEDIVKIRSKIDTRLGTFTTANDTQEAKKERDDEIKTDSVLKDLNKELDDLRKQRDAIVNGDRTAYYVSQYRLLLNGNPLQPFLGFGNLNSFIRARYGKERYELSETQFEIAKEEYEKYKNGDKADTFRAIDIYNAFSEEFADNINATEKDLSGAITDSDLQTTVIGNTYFKYIKDKETAENRIKELESKESRTDEENAEIEDLKHKISDYDVQITSIRRNPSRTLYNTTSNANSLIEKLQRIANQTEVGSEVIVELMQDIKDAYKKWGSSKTLKRSQAELDTLYLLMKRIVPNKEGRWSGIENWISTYLGETGEETLEDQILTALKLKGKINDSTEIDETGFPVVDSIFNWEGRTKQKSHEVLENLLTKFYEDFGGDEGTVIEDYNNIVNFLKEQGLSDNEIKSFLYSDTGSGQLIPSFGEQTLPEFLQEIKELKANIKQSVLPKLLASITSKLNDTTSATIFEMLENEQKRLASKADIDEYTMDDIHEAALTQALYLLNAIKGMLVGASDGTNVEINKWKKSGKFAEISKDVAILVGEDIDEYINRISYLLKLNAMNKGMKLSEHKNIAVNMRVKFLEKLTDAIHAEPFKDLFSKTEEDGTPRFVDPKALWEEYKPTNFDTINAENYDNFEPTIIAYETRLFNEVKTLGFTDEEIVTKIMSIFGEGTDIWKQLSSKLSKNPDIVVTDFDFAIYLLSILTLNANDFYAKLNTVLKDFDKAPLYGHEYIVRTAYAMFLNPKAYNLLLDKIKSTYKGSDEYISKRKSIHNILFGFGGAGTGKSTSVAKLFKALTSDLGMNYVYLAFDDNQVKILTESVGAEDTEKRTTYKDFFAKIAGDQFKPENVVQKEDGTLSTVKPLTYNDYKELIDSSAKGTIFICDEIETLNELELELLATYAEEKGIFVLGLGDYKQHPSGKIKATNLDGKVQLFNSSFEDLVVLKTPSLTASLRTLSLAKNDNYNKLDLLVDTINYKMLENPEVYTTPSKLNEYVIEQTKAGINLDYYVEGNRMVGDHIIETEKEFKDNLEKALTIGGSTRTLIVADSSTISKYQADKYRNNPNVVVANIDQALGGEFDYVFVDVAFNKDNLFDELRKFYMLTQRSRLYTAVLDISKNYSGHLSLRSKENEQSNLILQMNSANIAEFKKWRLKGISELKPSENAESNLKPKAYVSGITPSSKVVESEPEPEPSPEPPEPEIKKPEVNEDNPEAPVDPEPAVEEPPIEEPPKPAPFVPKTPTRTNIPIGPTTSTENVSESRISTLFDEEERKETKDFITSFVPNPTDIPNVRFDDYFKEVFDRDFIIKEEQYNKSLFNLIKSQNKINNFGVLYQSLIKDIHSVVFASESLDKAVSAISNIIDNASRLYGIKLQALKDYVTGTKSQAQIVLKRNGKGSDIILRLYKSVSANDFVDIYIGKSSISKNGVYTGWFTKTSQANYKRGKRITIAQLKAKYPGLTVINAAGVLIGSLVNNMTGSETFAEWNDGKAFIAVGEIIGNPDPETIFRESASGDYVWTYNDSDKLRLAGIQKVLSPDDICKFLTCWDYIKWEHLGGALTGESNKKYIEGERRRNLQKYGFIGTDGSVNILSILSTLAAISGKDAWNSWGDLTEEDKNSLLNEDGYIGTPATIGSLFANVLNEICINPSQYSESNLWYNLRRELCTDIGSRKLWIKTKDGKVYQLAAVEESKTNTDGKKLFSKSWKLMTEDGTAIVTRNYSGVVGTSFADMLRGMFSTAGIDLQTSKALILRKVEKDGITYWNVHNTNQVLYEILGPFITSDKKIETFFKSLPNGFYANIRSDTRIQGGPWKKVTLDGMEHIYTTDASEWTCSTYKLDEDQLLPDETSAEKVDLINEWKDIKSEIINVASKTIDSNLLKQITDYYESQNKTSDLNSATDLEQYTKNFIESINNQILASTNTKFTKILEYDDWSGAARLVSIDTKNQAIQNALEKEGFDLSNTQALFDGLRTTIGSNSISIFTDNSTTVIIYFNDSGETVVKLTGVGQELADLLLNINNFIPIDTAGLTEEATEALNRSQSRARTSIAEYLIHFAKNEVDITEANKVIDIMNTYETLSNAISNYLEKRLNSELDEC